MTKPNALTTCINCDLPAKPESITFTDCHAEGKFFNTKEAASSPVVVGDEELAQHIIQAWCNEHAGLAALGKLIAAHRQAHTAKLAAEVERLRDGIGMVQAGLDFLRMAINAQDQQEQLILRVNDLVRECLALTPAKDDGGQG